MGIREDVLALADDVESTMGGCHGCLLDKRGLCKAETDFDCSDEVCKFVAHRLRAIAEKDAEDVTTVSAYDLLPEDEREAIAWVREHGGLAEVEKRLMPEGVEWLLEVWPRWSNGEYCKFGDWWMSDKYGDSEPMQFRRLSIYTPEQLDEWGQGDGESYGYEWGFVRPSDPKYRPDKVEPPAPKVLDADGVEISVGDVLYSVETGGSVTVDSIEPGNPWFATTDGALQHCAKFTHRAPVLAADGKPLEVGQTVWDVESGIEYKVVGIHTDEDTPVRVMRTDGSHLAKAAKPSTLTHQRPVLDADGVPIREGDTVYVLGFGEPLTVKGFTDDGRVLMSFHDENSLGYKPSKLTHERPDSWELLEEDARELDISLDGENTSDYPRMSHVRDLVRRAKKLAGVSE